MLTLAGAKKMFENSEYEVTEVHTATEEDFNNGKCERFEVGWVTIIVLKPKGIEVKGND